MKKLFTQASTENFQPTLPGVTIKTLVYGEKTLMVEVHLQKGSELPLHKHPHEQTGTMLSGAMRLIVEDQPFEVRPGDSWCVPGDAQHRVEVMQDSVVVEVFAPLREDYLVYLPKAAGEQG